MKKPIDKFIMIQKNMLKDVRSQIACARRQKDYCRLTQMEYYESGLEQSLTNYIASRGD